MLFAGPDVDVLVQDGQGLLGDCRRSGDGVNRPLVLGDHYGRDVGADIKPGGIAGEMYDFIDIPGIAFRIDLGRGSQVLPLQGC